MTEVVVASWRPLVEPGVLAAGDGVMLELVDEEHVVVVPPQPLFTESLPPPPPARPPPLRRPAPPPPVPATALLFSRSKRVSTS